MKEVSRRRVLKDLISLGAAAVCLRFFPAGVIGANNFINQLKERNSPSKPPPPVPYQPPEKKNEPTAVSARQLIKIEARPTNKTGMTAAAKPITPIAVEQKIEPTKDLFSPTKVESVSTSGQALESNELNSTQTVPVPKATRKSPIPTLSAIEDRLSAAQAQCAGNEIVGQYQIKPGDNLGAIARKLGVSQKNLIAANGIVNPNKIRAGDILVYCADRPPATPTRIKKSPTPILKRRPATATPTAEMIHWPTPTIAKEEPERTATPTKTREKIIVATRPVIPTVEHPRTSKDRVVQGKEAAKKWIAGAVSDFLKTGRISPDLISAIEVGDTQIKAVLPISLDFKKLPWLTKNLVRGLTRVAGFQFDETKPLSFLAAIVDSKNFNLPPLPPMPPGQLIGVSQEALPGLGEFKMISYAPLNEKGLTAGTKRVVFLVGSKSEIESMSVNGGRIKLAAVNFSRLQVMAPEGSASLEACQQVREAQKMGKRIVFTAAFDFSGGVLRTVGR